MIALQISEIKDFMNKLLCSEVFDNFLLQEASINTNASYHIEGHVNTDFYSKEELEEEGLSQLSFMPYGKIRPQCFQLIKGKRTPTFFKFVLLLSPQNLERTLAQVNSPFTSNDITGMFLNIKFQNGCLLLTTGVSYRIFSTDKGLDKEWDQLVRRFLNGHDISFDEL